MPGMLGDIELRKFCLKDKFAEFSEHWKPVIVGEVNDCTVKLVKFKGEFCWHSHEFEDELFLVVSGEFVMRFRSRNIKVSEGEIIIVPKGIEHMPVAITEVQVLLVEPKSTVNTGNIVNERTITELTRL
jgi:mannose-6-phosphate isomerase-like protein (cupin superfamily)